MMTPTSTCNTLLQARASTLMDAETRTLFQNWLTTKAISSFDEMKKLTTLPLNSSLPITYDPRKRLCPVMDQGGCGSCVFFAITTLLSDMVSIQRKQPVIPLSVQYVMECMYYCFDQESTLPPQPISMDTACGGNSPFFVGTFLRRISSSSVHGEGGCKKTGTVAQTCKPYIVENIAMCQTKRSGVIWKLGTYILSPLLSIFLIVRILFLGKSTPAFHQKIDALILISISLYFLVLMMSCIFFVYRTKQRDRSTTPSLSKKEAKLSALLILVTGAGFLLTFMALNRSLFHYNLSTGIYARNVILILIGACLVGSTIFMSYYEKHVVELSSLEHVLPTMNVSCDDKCADGSPIKTRYYVQDVYTLFFPSTTSLAEKIKTLKSILYSKGPIGVLIVPRYSFMILDMYHHGTIYDPEKKKNDPYMGDMHALCIIGWHKDAWILRNSWGSCWGDNGYCYWKMGADHIENFCYFLTAEN